MDIEFLKQLFVLVGEIEDKKLSDYVIVIILAIVMCMIISLIIKLINITSVEKIFMDSKQNRINSFYKLIAMMIVFTPFNYLLSRLKAFIAIEIILIIITVVRIIIFKCQEKKAKKNESADTSKELNISNKNKIEDAVIFLIITVSPVTLYFFSIRLMSSISEFNCAIMVGIIEVLIICLAIPQLVVSDSRCYFIMHNIA